MTKETKQEFILRISQSNRSQLVVVIYQIILLYLNEAKQSLENHDFQEFRDSIRKAQPFITELMEALDFKYEISMELMQLYVFVNKSLFQSMIKKDLSKLQGAVNVMEKLKKGFEKVSESDTSPPVMKNTQQVYAGLTYGKESLTEILEHNGNSRGYLI